MTLSYHCGLTLSCLLTNNSTAFKWKLHCHRLIGLRQRQVAVADKYNNWCKALGMMVFFIVSQVPPPLPDLHLGQLLRRWTSALTSPWPISYSPPRLSRRRRQMALWMSIWSETGQPPCPPYLYPMPSNRPSWDCPWGLPWVSWCCFVLQWHGIDVMASKNADYSTVCATAFLGAQQRKHQSYLRMQLWIYHFSYTAIQVISIFGKLVSGLILSLRPANERRRYKVTPSLIGWAQT